ncbi:MAG: ABC transporter ATP-binding protein [Acidimicrobiia bacterium]|nr:ABC transporter ATP-binding protein [Acidimicrobiia bacterium]
MTDTRTDIRPFRFGWRTGTFRRGLWGASWVLWTAFFLLPLWTGWLLKLVFDALAESQSVNGLLIAIGVSEAVGWIVFWFAIYYVVRWWLAALTLLRTNMLAAQTESGGPRAATLPASPAEAITRFGDDARDAVLWTDSWLDGSGMIVYSIGAMAVMSSIHLGAAFIALVPVAVVTAITRYLTPRLYAARAADREATSRVTSFLGEAFAGLLAFRLAGKEEAAIHRLERHTAIRRRTAVRDTVLQQTVDGIASSTSDVTIGLTLLVLVPAVRSGEFSVGDLALFVAYAVELGQLPRFLARLITSREQAMVAYGRMGDMVASDRIDDLLDHIDVTIEPNDQMLERLPDPERVALDHLEIRGLTSVYPGGSSGVADVNLDIERGSFVVVTGGVGSGKSTLLRAIVGLSPMQAGTIRWNGAEIDDPAAWFVPPNAAYLPQVPNLFSETLADNIALGRETSRLDEVLELTTLRTDLADMPQGVHTTVGARGLRLSGGQAQRVATARALFTKPELLVVDDVSSALDVNTERELWQRLRSDGSSTIIAISHRQHALERADQVITMEAGRVASVDRRASP